MMNEKVDASRSDKWPEEMRRLRSLLRSCGLTEEIKWAKPCFSHDGANVVILQEMKDFLALMFFKGVLLNDPAGVLEDQGPNSRSARRICFRSVDDVDRLADIVTSYVDEAIGVEDAGLQLGPPPELVLAEELQRRLDSDTELKAAFEGLTPGRQREYHLYVSGAKHAATREARVEKYTQKILDGKGSRDR